MRIPLKGSIRVSIITVFTRVCIELNALIGFWCTTPRKQGTQRSTASAAVSYSWC